MYLTSCLLMQSCSRAVQSPALLIWNMMNSSDGTEVMVKGCHSAHEIWGTFRCAYCPGLQSKHYSDGMVGVVSVMSDCIFT